MKSVRTKLIASILICSLFTSVLIGVIAISNSVRTAGKDAMTMMQLTGQKKTEEINSTIQKIEQSVDTLSEVAMSNFDMIRSGRARIMRIHIPRRYSRRCLILQTIRMGQ